MVPDGLRAYDMQHGLFGHVPRGSTRIRSATRLALTMLVVDGQLECLGWLIVEVGRWVNLPGEAAASPMESIYTRTPTSGLDRGELNERFRCL